MKASELAERLMRHSSAEVTDVNVVVWYEATDRIELQASGAVTIPRSVVEGQIEGMLRDLGVCGLDEANSTYPPDLSRIPPYQRLWRNTKTGEIKTEDEYRQMLDGKLHEGKGKAQGNPLYQGASGELLDSVLRTAPMPTIHDEGESAQSDHTSKLESTWKAIKDAK